MSGNAEIKVVGRKVEPIDGSTFPWPEDGGKKYGRIVAAWVQTTGAIPHGSLRVTVVTKAGTVCEGYLIGLKVVKDAPSFPKHNDADEE